MSAPTSKGRFRAALACLLIICLSPAAMPLPCLYAGNDPGAASEDVLFVPRIVSSTPTVPAYGMRIRIKGFNDLLKAALIPGETPIVFARKPSPCSYNPDAGIAHRANCTAIPVRAPPSYNHARA